MVDTQAAKSDRPMIERELVLAHRQLVIGADRGAYMDDRRDMRVAAQGLSLVTRRLTRIDEHALRFSASPADLPSSQDLPRMGMSLLEAAYVDGQVPSSVTPDIENFIRAYAVPRLGLPDQPVVTEAIRSGRIPDSCSMAEPMFVHALRQVESGIGVHARISVYHTTGGLPLALRKTMEDSSALLLEPVKVGDMTVHAGTIVGIGNGGQRLSGEYTHPEQWQLTSYEVPDGDFAIQPARPSAWAFGSPLDQALFATEKLLSHPRGYVDYYPTRASTITGFTIADFRNVALLGLQQTGVRPKATVPVSTSI